MIRMQATVGHNHAAWASHRVRYWIVCVAAEVSHTAFVQWRSLSISRFTQRWGAFERNFLVRCRLRPQSIIYILPTHTHTPHVCMNEVYLWNLHVNWWGVRLYERTHSRFVGIFVFFFLVEWKLNWKQKPNLMNINVICVCVCAGAGLDCNLPNDNDTSTWYIGIMHLLIWIGTIFEMPFLVFVSIRTVGVLDFCSWSLSLSIPNALLFSFSLRLWLEETLLIRLLFRISVEIGERMRSFIELLMNSMRCC